MLQRHSEDTPQQLHSILTRKKQFYIYSYIKNLFFNIFCIRCYTFYIIPMPNNPCNNEGVSYHIGDEMIVLINAIQLSYLSVLLSENDPKEYFHTNKISFTLHEENSFGFVHHSCVLLVCFNSLTSGSIHQFPVLRVLFLRCDLVTSLGFT